MSVLFGRVAQVQVDTLLVTGLRITFKVEKKGSADPNTAQVVIYNLAETTRQQLSKLDSARVLLTAGYVGTAALLFAGDARRKVGIQHVRQGPDWLTKIECGDGERAYQDARFSGSFAAGTKVAEVAKAMARKLGVGLGNLEQALAGGGFRQGLSEYPLGFTAHGSASTELFRLLRGLGFEASIQDGQLLVLKPGEVAPGKAVLLSTRTKTIIGSPQYNSAEKDKGAPQLKVKTQLQPALKPGVPVKVESEAVSGSFKAKAVSHTGDTHGGEWTSDCLLVAV